MLRVRSIDPHDFCYVDITLYPDFFENYVVEKEWAFAIESSKLTSILPTLDSERIFMRIGEGFVNFSTKESWVTAFTVKWLRSDPYDLPEPNAFKYEAVANIPAKELSDIIHKASTISHEVSFSADSPNKLMILAVKEDYSFTAQPMNPHFEISVKQPVAVSIIIDYLKMLRYLINKCESAKLFIGNEKPLRVELKYENKGIFSFSFSHKRKEKPERVEKRERGGTSLPRVSMKSFEKYLIQLSKYPDGAEPQIFVMASLETQGGDCWRLSDILTLAYKDKGKIKLTTLGQAFVSLYEKDEYKAKQFFHMVAKSTIVPYKLMIETLETPVTQDEIRERINALLEKDYRYKINGQDLSTMLEIARWCGILKKKANLFSFKEGERITEITCLRKGDGK